MAGGAVTITAEATLSPGGATDSADDYGLLTAGLMLAGVISGMAIFDRKKNPALRILDDVFCGDMTMFDK